MTIQPAASDGQRVRRCPLRAFTLVELLVVTSVIGLLLGMMLPALSGARGAAKATVELAAAQQMMLGYTAHYQEHRGKVLPGHPRSDMIPAMSVKDEVGRPLENPVAMQRYPWRLLPYLEYTIAGLFPNEATLRDMQRDDRQNFIYTVSLMPWLGLNSYFLGGNSQMTPALAPAFDDRSTRALGAGWYVHTANQITDPSGQLVFASARSNESYLGDDVARGYYKVTPPYFLDRIWPSHPSDDAEAIETLGYVALRHNGRAVAGFFDGHAGMLDWEEMQDMRHWSAQADRPDWVLTPRR